MMNSLPNILLQIARQSILEELTGKKLIDKQAYINQYPKLAQKQAVFVTLNKQRTSGEAVLRGCIGSIIPHRSLMDDLVYNAKAAAFKDPRFPPLTLDELEQIKIEISLLSIPKTLKYNSVEGLRNIIKIGKHGVILNLSGRQATFLPQVWEQLPDFDLFFNHLCQKAGLPANCLPYNPEIRIYEVNKIEEDE